MKLITHFAAIASLAFAATSAWADTATLKIGKQTVRAEIVNTPQSRERGLMGRESLCSECGMLFVFNRADRYAFWMKNTPLPLSIAFIASDGTIINTDEMQPHTTNTHSSQGDALYALEMNSKWFAHNKIKPGDKVIGLERVPKAHQ